MRPSALHSPGLLLLGLLPLAPALAQAPATPAPAPRPSSIRNAIVLDPAHGGDDTGAHLPDGTLEKDVTLALADRIRLQLNTFGLPVLLTRDIDPAPSPGSADKPAPADLTPDQRAGLANHSHPIACLVLHATATGTGIHIVTADLAPAPAPEDPDHPGPTPWLDAQAPFLPQSDRLASEIATSLSRAGLPLNRSRAFIRPLVSLTCPAILLELAPLSRSQPVTTATYQARVAQAVATALLFFRNQLTPPAASDTTTPAAAQP